MVDEQRAVLVNSFCWERRELIVFDKDCEPSDSKKPRVESDPPTQTLHDGSIVGMSCTYVHVSCMYVILDVSMVVIVTAVDLQS